MTQRLLSYIKVGVDDLEPRLGAEQYLLSGLLVCGSVAPIWSLRTRTITSTPPTRATRALDARTALCWIASSWNTKYGGRFKRSYLNRGSRIGCGALSPADRWPGSFGYCSTFSWPASSESTFWHFTAPRAQPNAVVAMSHEVSTETNKQRRKGACLSESGLAESPKDQTRAAGRRRLDGPLESNVGALVSTAAGDIW